MNVLLNTSEARHLTIISIIFIRRQLSTYGFQRVAKGKDTGSFYHKLFRRNRTDLLPKILRVSELVKEEQLLLFPQLKLATSASATAAAASSSNAKKQSSSSTSPSTSSRGPPKKRKAGVHSGKHRHR